LIRAPARRTCSTSNSLLPYRSARPSLWLSNEALRRAAGGAPRSREGPPDRRQTYHSRAGSPTESRRIERNCLSSNEFAWTARAPRWRDGPGNGGMSTRYESRWPRVGPARRRRTRARSETVWFELEPSRRPSTPRGARRKRATTGCRPLGTVFSPSTQRSRSQHAEGRQRRSSSPSPPVPGTGSRVLRGGCTRRRQARRARRPPPSPGSSRSRWGGPSSREMCRPIWPRSPSTQRGHRRKIDQIPGPHLGPC
jgi:hypothetical protein